MGLAWDLHGACMGLAWACFCRALDITLHPVHTNQVRARIRLQPRRSSGSRGARLGHGHAAGGGGGAGGVGAAAGVAREFVSQGLQQGIDSTVPRCLRPSLPPHTSSRPRSLPAMRLMQAPTVVPGVLSQMLQQHSATGRLLAALALNEWLLLESKQLNDRQQQQQQQQQQQGDETPRESLLASTSAAHAAALAALVPPELPALCLTLLGAATAARPCPPGAEPYAETAGASAAMRKDVTAALDAMIRAGVQLAVPVGASLDSLSTDAALQLLGQAADPGSAAAAARAAALGAIAQLQALEAYLHGGCCLALASAVAASGRLPEKLTPVLGSLMQSLRREPVAALQRVGARGLAELLLCCVARSPCPNDKVVRNLAAMACGDPLETPQAADPAWCVGSGLLCFGGLGRGVLHGELHGGVAC